MSAVIRVVISIAIALALLSGCSSGVGPFDQAPNGAVTVDYRSAPSSSSRLVGSSTNGVYDADLYGELIETLTPSQFVLPLLSMTLFDHSPGTFDDPDFDLHQIDYTTGPDERFYADFLSDVPLLYEPEIVPGVYDGLYLYIPESPGRVTYGQGDGPAFEWNPEAQIEVTLPAEYESIELQVVADWANPSGDPNAREMSKSGRSVTTNAVGTLMGEVMPFLYVFGDTAAPELFNSSGAVIKPGEIFHASSLPSSTNAPIIRAPFTPIEVPEDGFEELAVIVAIDLEGIVHLYDSGTPDDLTDDVLIVAPEFWNRISVDMEMNPGT
jgi:hypothetical protein